MLRDAPLLGWLGTMSPRNASLALAAGTLLGVAGTLLAGSEPGFLLSFFIIIGSLVATLGVRRDAVYVFFPVPALVFFVAAVMTGTVHDSSLTSSTVGLSSGFLQWIAAIFVPASVATVLVLAVGGGRWLLARQLADGQSPLPGRPGSQGSARPVPGRPRRPDASGSRSGQDRPGTPRADRDPWGDPRPRRDARPARPAQPRDPRTQSRDPREPRPQRPAQGQRSPRDPWDQ